MSGDQVVLTPMTQAVNPSEVDILGMIHSTTAQGAVDLANQLQRDPNLNEQTRSGLVNGMALLVGYFRLRVDQYGKGIIPATLGSMADLGIDSMNRVISASNGGQKKQPEPEPEVQEVIEEESVYVEEG